MGTNIQIIPLVLTLGARTATTTTLSFPAITGATSIKIQQSTNGTDWNDSTTEALTAVSTSATVTGLTANTPYKFRLVMNNDFYGSPLDVPAEIAGYTAVAAATNSSPIAGTNNGVTLTVKNSAGSTDTTFTGFKNVTVSGYSAAPNGSYGSFTINGLAPVTFPGIGGMPATSWDSPYSAGGPITTSSATMNVYFKNGVATPDLILNNAAAQNVVFNIDGVSTPATNAVTITPVPDTEKSIDLTRDITAPTVNGGQFAQHPKVAIEDKYGNICVNDNSTQVTVGKNDGGAWDLTGTTTKTVNDGVADFNDLGATNAVAVTGAQLAFNATGFTQITSGTVNLPVPSVTPASTAGVAVANPSPTAGVNDAVTLTVKNSDGSTDTTFSGTKDVTISGYTAAPDGSYGSFSPMAMEASGLSGDPNSITGISKTISLYFYEGVASANLALNNAAAQNVVFNIDGVSTPTTNTVAIAPIPATVSSMQLTQDITAPAANGGQFAQQPKVTLKDAYGNICVNDNSTQVTAGKNDGGTWTLTGTTTETVSNGVATFSDLRATNEAAVTGAKLAFNATGCTQITSGTVDLPASAAPASTVGAAVANSSPVAGVNDAVTLTVKNSDGSTDTTFSGAKDVTISGYTAAPDGSYGSFSPMAITASGLSGNPNSITGISKTISLYFYEGVASANLALNNAAAQNVVFNIDGVSTPTTNTVAIAPIPATVSSMQLTQDITAPAANGGQFAQQPKVTLKDTYGNICINDNSTQVTAGKNDGGTWNLTGTTTETVSHGVATFSDLRATNGTAVTGAKLSFNATGCTQITSGTVDLPASAAPASTVGAAVANLSPVAGVNDAVTLTVKNSDGSTDTTFSGAKDVTISGYTAAPDGSYGSFSPMAIAASGLSGNADSITGTSKTISLYFDEGVARANLALNNAAAQNVVFNIAGVSRPATNTVAIAPVPATASSMQLTQDITAPAANGGQFAEQPKVTLKDAYGNICVNDNSTRVTAGKNDRGTWNLTGTTAKTVSDGVATFSDLGATNGAAVTGAQLAFSAIGCTQTTSRTVDLPVLAATPSVNSVTVTPAAASVVQGETKQLRATVNAVGGAAETVNWSSGDSKVTVDSNGLVTVASDATPEDYIITATSTADSSKRGTATITVTTSAAVTYKLNYTAEAGGKIEGDSSQTVAEGNNGTTVTAVANKGYHFVGWSDGKTDANRKDTDVNEDINVSAEFELDLPSSTSTTPAGVTIIGNQQVDNTLEAQLIDENGSNFTTSSAVKYKWYRVSGNDSEDGTQVGEGKTYKVVSDDIGKYIKVVASYISETFEKITSKILGNPSSSSTSSSSHKHSNGSTTSSTSSTQQITVKVTDGSSDNSVSQTVIERTTAGDGTKKDNVTYTADKAKETLAALANEGKDTARIVAEDSDTSVSETKVDIPSDTLTALSSGNVNLEIQTNGAIVSVPKESVQGLAGSGQLNGDLYFRVVPIKDQAKQAEIKTTADKQAVIRAASGNNGVQVLGTPMTIETNMSQRSVDIVLPLTGLSLPTDAAERQAFLNDLGVFIEHSDGEKVLQKGQVVEYAAGVFGIKFTVNKFSDFTIVKLNKNNQTGWKQNNGDWYFLNNDGTMARGWHKADAGEWTYKGKDTKDTWFHLDNDYKMNTGWFKDTDGSWYFLCDGKDIGALGAMETGWKFTDGKWYYLKENGVMATGWTNVDGNWYYLYSDGSMASNTVIDGYTLDANGAWIK